MMNLIRARAPIACAATVAGAGLAYFATNTVSANPVQAESKKPKLTYFDIAGRAFVIRAALRHANVPFEDVRISFPQLVQARGPNGANEKVPLGQLPILELPSGEVLCQSMSILRWAGKKSDLYPKDPDQALLVDEVSESITELRNKIPEHKDDAERKRLREEYLQTVLPKYMDYLTRRLQSHGGPFFLGKQFSMADLILARVVAGIADKRYDYITKEHLEKWPAVMRHYEATCKHPIYAAEQKAEEDHQKQSASKTH